VADPLYVAALDAGSAYTRYLVGAVERGRLRLLGAGRSLSQGWARGRIADLPAVVESLRSAIAEGERAAGVSPDSAVVGVGGAGVEGVDNRGLYEMGRRRPIEPGDTRYAIERALEVNLPAGRMLLQAAPQSFLVDGQDSYWDPQGVAATRLESFVHLLTVSRQEHDSLVSAVHRAHLAVEDTVFEAYAAALAAVTPEERRAGVAIVDIGLHSTEMAVFLDDALQTTASIPIGGIHFTRDAAHCLRLSVEDAEQLKCEWGCALRGLSADNTFIEIPSPDGLPPREAPRHDLNLALESRAGELFLRVQNQLSKAGTDQGQLGQVVLTGGGSLLSGMWNMAERVLNCRARLGLVNTILDWPEELRTADWTTAGGLLIYAARLRLRSASPARPGWLSRLFG